MVHLRRDVAHVIEALRAKGVLVGRTFPSMVQDLRVSVEAAEEMNRFQVAGRGTDFAATLAVHDRTKRGTSREGDSRGYF